MGGSQAHISDCKQSKCELLTLVSYYSLGRWIVEVEQKGEVRAKYGKMDGARLGYGLMSEECDLTLPEIAALCDVFTIGGTKVGALCGEALVFKEGMRPQHFMTSVKKRGGRLCKRGGFGTYRAVIGGL